MKRKKKRKKKDSQSSPKSLSPRNPSLKSQFLRRIQIARDYAPLAQRKPSRNAISCATWPNGNGEKKRKKEKKEKEKEKGEINSSRSRGGARKSVEGEESRWPGQYLYDNV